ncbi:hypothetical protein CYMTET_25399 [Cymbomonas tetramitiformis]|uniref:Uncharacterized protein n=1 Tax=Cymbomonas tetramitiformis TaxID=36881 RepID=A0AAE0FTY4_9CHLO|nr:hypothetical protein CYMTET_25399 [Cymbomonas tetramitiformis]
MPSTRRYRRGEVYSGGFWRAKRHGLGEMRYADGSTYQGRWCFGLRHGWGAYWNVGVRFEGLWKGDLPWGRSPRWNPLFSLQQLSDPLDMDVPVRAPAHVTRNSQRSLFPPGQKLTATLYSEWLRERQRRVLGQDNTRRSVITDEAAGVSQTPPAVLQAAELGRLQARVQHTQTFLDMARRTRTSRDAGITLMEIGGSSMLKYDKMLAQHRRMPLVNCFNEWRGFAARRTWLTGQVIRMQHQWYTRGVVKYLKRRRDVTSNAKKLHLRSLTREWFVFWASFSQSNALEQRRVCKHYKIALGRRLVRLWHVAARRLQDEAKRRGILKWKGNYTSKALTWWKSWHAKRVEKHQFLASCRNFFDNSLLHLVVHAWFTCGLELRQIRTEGLLALFRQYCQLECIMPTRSGVRTLESIAKVSQDSLLQRHLDFRYHYLGDRGASCMVQTLDRFISAGSCCVVITLDLSGNGIHDRSAAIISDMLQGYKWKNLTSLDLRDNEISARGGLQLLRLLERQPGIVQLRCEGNPIGDIRVQEELEALLRSNMQRAATG